MSIRTNKRRRFHYTPFVIPFGVLRIIYWRPPPFTLRHCPHDYFHSESCTAGRLVATSRVKFSSAISAGNEAGQAVSTIFMFSVWLDQDSKPSYQLRWHAFSPITAGQLKSKFKVNEIFHLLCFLRQSTKINSIPHIGKSVPNAFPVSANS